MTTDSDQQINVPILLAEKKCLPRYATEGASGADVIAFIPEPWILSPGQSLLVPTGTYVAIPRGFEIQVRPRSGLAFHHQISIVNTPGTIDVDYRGEIKVLLINLGQKPFTIEPNMKIAQLVLAPVVYANFTVCETLPPTTRGAGGFGHTGFIHQENK